MCKLHKLNVLKTILLILCTKSFYFITSNHSLNLPYFNLALSHAGFFFNFDTLLKI